MSKRANDDLLSLLHAALAETLLQKVKSEEVTASELAVIAKFLKDNNITVNIDDDPNMKELAKHSLPTFDDDEVDNIEVRH